MDSMCDNFSHKVFTRLYFSAVPVYDCTATEPVFIYKPLLTSIHELASMLFFLIHLLTTLVTNTYDTYVHTYFSRFIHFIACNSKAVKTSHKQYCRFKISL